MRMVAVAGLIMLAGCNEGFVSRNTPGTACPPISEARFAELVKAGATRGDAKIYASGITSMAIGPGVVQCASGPQPRICRRPNDFVIRYELADGTLSNVHVPAGSQYRMTVAARPTTCEIVAQP